MDKGTNKDLYHLIKRNLPGNLADDWKVFKYIEWKKDEAVYNSNCAGYLASLEIIFKEIAEGESESTSLSSSYPPTFQQYVYSYSTRITDLMLVLLLLLSGQPALSDNVASFIKVINTFMSNALVTGLLPADLRYSIPEIEDLSAKAF